MKKIWSNIRRLSYDQRAMPAMKQKSSAREDHHVFIAKIVIKIVITVLQHVLESPREVAIERL